MNPKKEEPDDISLSFSLKTVLAIIGAGAIGGGIVDHAGGYTVLEWIGKGIWGIVVLAGGIMILTEYEKWRKGGTWLGLLKSIVGFVLIAIVLAFLLGFTGYMMESSSD